MVVEQHECRGAGGRGRAKDLPRVHNARVERAPRHHGGPQQAVLRVEQPPSELFDRPRAELRHQELRGVPRSDKLEAIATPPDERSPASLHRRDELRGARAADARHAAQIIRGRARQTMQSTDGVEHRVREVQHASPGNAVPQDDRQQLVVAEPAGADALELFTRPIVRRNGLHRTSSCCYTLPAVRRLPPQTMPFALLRHRTTARLLLFILILIPAAGCSEPPRKEIDQAQTAVDLAGTAGADKFAAEEYAAAVAGLQKARDAVEQRDYRQALSYAIDARQRAQDAIRQAADAKAKAQRATDSLVTDVTARANQLRTRLKGAEAARVPAKELRAPRAAMAEAQQGLQEARAEIGAGNYQKAEEILTALRPKLHPPIPHLDHIPPRGARGGRAKPSTALRRELPPSP